MQTLSWQMMIVRNNSCSAYGWYWPPESAAQGIHTLQMPGVSSIGEGELSRLFGREVEPP